MRVCQPGSALGQTCTSPEQFDIPSSALRMRVNGSSSLLTVPWVPLLSVSASSVFNTRETSQCVLDTRILFNNGTGIEVCTETNSDCFFQSQPSVLSDSCSALNPTDFIYPDTEARDHVLDRLRTLRGNPTLEVDPTFSAISTYINVASRCIKDRGTTVEVGVNLMNLLENEAFRFVTLLHPRVGNVRCSGDENLVSPEMCIDTNAITFPAPWDGMVFNDDGLVCMSSEFLFDTTSDLEDIGFVHPDLLPSVGDIRPVGGSTILPPNGATTGTATGCPFTTNDPTLCQTESPFTRRCFETENPPIDEPTLCALYR